MTNFLSNIMQALTQCEQTLSTLGVGQEVVQDRGMLFHELVSVCEREQKNKTESF
jgi:hypothetical protein